MLGRALFLRERALLAGADPARLFPAAHAVLAPWLRRRAAAGIPDPGCAHLRPLRCLPVRHPLR
jgi:hypothetical protein